MSQMDSTSPQQLVTEKLSPVEDLKTASQNADTSSEQTVNKDEVSMAEVQEKKEESYHGKSLPESEQPEILSSDTDDASSDSQREEKGEAKEAVEPTVTAGNEQHGDDIKEDVKGSNTEEGEKEEKKEYKWQDLLGNEKLMKKKIRMAEDPLNRPQQGQRAHIKYIGKVKATGEQVDSGQRWLGVMEGDVIQAIDITVAAMAKGELTEVHSHSDLCWGEKGRGPEIPPNTDMIYEIELQDFEEGMDANKVTAEALLDEMNRRKDIGNGWLKRGDSFFAIQSYTRALQLLESRTDNSKESSADCQKLVDMRLVLLNNLAQAALKNGAWERAVEHAEKVLQSQPDNEKALYRKAKGLESSGKFPEAKKCLDRLCNLFPDTKLYRSTLETVKKKLHAERDKEKKMYGKMFNISPAHKAKAAKSKDGGSWLGWAVGAAVVAVMAVTAYRMFSS